MKTTAKDARKALGNMPEGSVERIAPHAAGHLGADTWSLILAKDVPGWGKRGDIQLFPVPYSTEVSHV